MNKTLSYYAGCLQGAIDDAVLSAEEWQQANKFTRPEKRQQFIEIRHLVRHYLSLYVDCPPQQLTILRTATGKPYLADYPDIFFNLSHCQKQWVLVITTGGRIGVDIEAIRPRKGLDGLVKRCFSLSEQKAWQQLEEDKKLRRFYQYWTAKEAFVKAVGRGIALGLDNVQIAFTPQPELMQIPLAYGDKQNWRLLRLPNKNSWIVTACVEIVDDQEIEPGGCRIMGDSTLAVGNRCIFHFAYKNQ
jgi:4'-phosphopantetheinyl transferase